MVLFATYTGSFLDLAFGVTALDASSVLRWLVLARIATVVMLNLRRTHAVGDRSEVFTVMVLVPFLVMIVLALARWLEWPTHPVTPPNTGLVGAFGISLFMALSNSRGWGDTVAFPELAMKVGGHWLGIWVAVGGMVCAAGLFNAVTLTDSCIPFSLAACKYLPVAVTRHPVHGTLVAPILVCAVIYAVLAIGLFVSLAVTITAVTMIGTSQAQGPNFLELAGVLILAGPLVFLLTRAALERGAPDVHVPIEYDEAVV